MSGSVPAYGPDLRSMLAGNLAAHPRTAIDVGSLRHAAVAMVIVDSDAVLHGEDPDPPGPDGMSVIPGIEGQELDGSVAGTAGGPAFLLTRRAAKLRAHGGQWALPGGRLNEGERPVDAALRETEEEVGLRLSELDLLGTLDDYVTRSGYVITPCVFWGGASPVLTPDPAEVQSVHRISFRELCRADSPRFVTIPESDRPVVQVPIGRDLIHAPTGAVMLQFRWVAIEGRSERVAHLEQPVFAWK